MADHHVYIRDLHKSSEPQGKGVPGLELARIYHGEGRPGTFEDFAKSTGNEKDKWIFDRIERLRKMEEARWSEAEIREKVEKKTATDLLPKYVSDSSKELLAASKMQDIAGYTAGKEPSHPSMGWAKDDVNAYKELAIACRKEALRRQHELHLLLADTLTLVSDEAFRKGAWREPHTLDAMEQAEYLRARAQFGQAIDDAQRFLAKWSAMLQEKEPDKASLKELLADASLRRLHDVTMSLFPGVDHAKGPNAAYRLPAVLQAIGAQVSIQAQARSGVPSYGVMSARLEEIPHRDPKPPQSSTFALAQYKLSPGLALHELADICIHTYFNALGGDQSSEGKALKSLFGPQGSVRELKGPLNEALKDLQRDEWPTNKDAYKAVVDLAYRLKILKETIAKQFSGNADPVVKARAYAEGIIDAAVGKLLEAIAPIAN